MLSVITIVMKQTLIHIALLVVTVIIVVLILYMVVSLHRCSGDPTDCSDISYSSYVSKLTKYNKRSGKNVACK